MTDFNDDDVVKVYDEKIQMSVCHRSVLSFLPEEEGRTLDQISSPSLEGLRGALSALVRDPANGRE